MDFWSFKWRLRLVAAALLFLASVSACKRRSDPGPGSRPVNERSDVTAGTAANSNSAQTPAARSTAPAPLEIWKEFSGERALAEVKKQVDIGPRPSGSPTLAQARELITSALTAHGWDIERQDFTDETPRGAMKFTNLIARFSATTARPAPATTQQAIVCSHYDTKRFSTIQFVGANDAGSSTGALLELARVLSLAPSLAAKVELVFFDGEEALVQFSETDGVYGSRYYARSLRERNRVSQFKSGILWDMIGDKDLTITLSPDSPQPLTQQLLASAEALGLRQHFSYHDRAIWDDHVPLNQAGVPTINLIDFDYLAWHTADDTLQQLSAESLHKIGAVTLHYLHKALK